MAGMAGKKKDSRLDTCAVFARNGQLPVKGFFLHRSWQRKTSWAAITRWEQGGNKRRASVDEPPQLTSVDLHVAVSRPLRNNCGCAKAKSPWRIGLRAATRCNTVDVSSLVDEDGHAALHILCNYGERGHGAKASRGGLAKCFGRVFRKRSAGTGQCQSWLGSSQNAMDDQHGLVGGICGGNHGGLELQLQVSRGVRIELLVARYLSYLPCREQGQQACSRVSPHCERLARNIYEPRSHVAIVPGRVKVTTWDRPMFPFLEACQARGTQDESVEAACGVSALG